MQDQHDHDGHHDDDEVVLEIEVTATGQVRSWHKANLMKETVRQLADHLTEWERSMPDTTYDTDDTPPDKGAA